MPTAITMELVKLLQLPANTVRATLELTIDKPPLLTVEQHLHAVDPTLKLSRFELHEVTETVAPPPFDLDGMVADAQRRLAEFIDIRFKHHSFWRGPRIHIESRCDFTEVLKAVNAAMQPRTQQLVGWP